VRGDLRAFIGLGRGVLALRWTEARASGRTEPFQLGGASESVSTIGPVLNERELPLRGYRGDEPALLGRHARVASVEWRMPLVDIDRHGMVPPFGINRLSGTAFFDMGGAWDGDRPDRWRRGAGLELRGELKLLYSLAIDVRVGVARALDEPRGTRGYLGVGQAF
jgi:outer membrane protein assembly factor BamA